MAFEAILTIEDKTFRVFSFHYQSERDYDKFGRPTSLLYGCKMTFEVEHSPECILLHLWAYNNYEMKSGKITFMQRNSFQKQTEVRFSDGYIVNISTQFTSNGETPMIECFTICANKFEYESQGNLAIFDNEWPS